MISCQQLPLLGVTGPREISYSLGGSLRGKNQSNGSGQKRSLETNLTKNTWADMNRGFRILSTRSTKANTVDPARSKDVGFDIKSP